VSLLAIIEAYFILPIFVIKSYSTSAFATYATSTTSTTLLSERRSFRWSHLGHNNCLAVLVEKVQGLLTGLWVSVAAGGKIVP
jgi:hypothetical protein